MGLLLSPLFAQNDKDESNFGIKFSGFVKADYMFDTRQTVAVREGHFLLYPKAVENDAEGKDINAVPNLNMLAIQSRLTGKITGPDAFGAKTSGVIEGAFFGHSDGDINGFRLRHAFVKLDWGKTNLIAGQYWHAMFVTECFPGVISFNTGVPFQPFSRNPQLRITHSAGSLKIIGALQAQRDFTGYYFDPVSGNKVSGSAGLRNSGIPDMQFQVHYNGLDQESGNGIYAGIGVGYKFIKPSIYTYGFDTAGNVMKYSTNEMVASYSALGFIKYKNKPITVKLEGVYGQNMTDLLMLGGYAEYGIIDTLRNTVSYTPYNIMSTWLECHTNGKKIQGGLFLGYTQNLGVQDTIGGNVFARGANIKSVMRVAPRVVFISGKVKFATEIEYTSAAYQKGDPNGTTIEDILGVDNKGVINNTETASNIRLLLSLIYSF
ncbi:MAG: hypothetical protein Kow0068_16330 [Marinilabiliales bacterium]